ncbi:hypothetical protein WJX72_010023 [[Myrmecia] bisecta]|uniref:Uncharacterized protein n=1 Tax=[Myrmecia] bisecta TaxID=41462 RepID=A0AAW1QB96_9CHLO
MQAVPFGASLAGLPASTAWPQSAALRSAAGVPASTALPNADGLALLKRKSSTSAPAADTTPAARPATLHQARMRDPSPNPSPSGTSSGTPDSSHAFAEVQGRRKRVRYIQPVSAAWQQEVKAGKAQPGSLPVAPVTQEVQSSRQPSESIPMQQLPMLGQQVAPQPSLVTPLQPQQKGSDPAMAEAAADQPTAAQLAALAAAQKLLKAIQEACEAVKNGTTPATGSSHLSGSDNCDSAGGSPPARGDMSSAGGSGGPSAQRAQRGDQPAKDQDPDSRQPIAGRLACGNTGSPRSAFRLLHPGARAASVLLPLRAQSVPVGDALGRSDSSQLLNLGAPPCSPPKPASGHGAPPKFRARRLLHPAASVPAPPASSSPRQHRPTSLQRRTGVVKPVQANQPASGLNSGGGVGARGAVGCMQQLAGLYKNYASAKDDYLGQATRLLQAIQRKQDQALHGQASLAAKNEALLAQEAVLRAVQKAIQIVNVSSEAGSAGTLPRPRATGKAAA